MKFYIITKVFLFSFTGKLKFRYPGMNQLQGAKLLSVSLEQVLLESVSTLARCL